MTIASVTMCDDCETEETATAYDVENQYDAPCRIKAIPHACVHCPKCKRISATPQPEVIDKVTRGIPVILNCQCGAKIRTVRSLIESNEAKAEYKPAVIL